MIEFNLLKTDNIKVICKSKWCFYFAFGATVTVVACLIVLSKSNHVNHKKNIRIDNTKQATIKSNSQIVEGSNNVVSTYQ